MGIPEHGVSEQRDPDRLPPRRARSRGAGSRETRGSGDGVPAKVLPRNGNGNGEEVAWLRAIRRSAQRVLRNRRDAWGRRALSEGEAEALFEDLLTCLEAGGDAPDCEQSGARKALAQHLIDLVREDVLGADPELEHADLLTALRALEDIRGRLDPGWKESVASQLMGANALELVVEIAHDLRSPLTSVMFLAETLRKGQSGEINEVQRQQLGIIYSAALGLATMANDLMDAARETAPDSSLSPESFAMSELIESVRTMVAPMIEEKRLKLLFRVPDHDLRIGNPVPLGRVLLNLVTNAIKFTETGSIEILVEEGQRNRVEFSVLDTGRGMDADEITSLYEPFRRSESSTGFHFSNTGLGLSICARIVDLLGGELQVESRPGGGTRFFFQLELPRASRI